MAVEIETPTVCVATNEQDGIVCPTRVRRERSFDPEAFMQLGPDVMISLLTAEVQALGAENKRLQDELARNRQDGAQVASTEAVLHRGDWLSNRLIDLWMWQRKKDRRLPSHLLRGVAKVTSCLPHTSTILPDGSAVDYVLAGRLPIRGDVSSNGKRKTRKKGEELGLIRLIVAKSVTAPQLEALASDRNAIADLVQDGIEKRGEDHRLPDTLQINAINLAKNGQNYEALYHISNTYLPPLQEDPDRARRILLTVGAGVSGAVTLSLIGVGFLASVFPPAILAIGLGGAAVTAGYVVNALPQEMRNKLKLKV